MLINRIVILLTVISITCLSCKQKSASITHALSNINDVSVVVKILREGILLPKGQETIDSKTRIDSLRIDTLSALVGNIFKSHIASVHSLSDSIIPSCMDGLGVDSYITFTINSRLIKISFICEQYGNGYLYDSHNNLNYEVIFTDNGKNTIENAIQSIREKME